MLQELKQNTKYCEPTVSIKLNLAESFFEDFESARSDMTFGLWKQLFTVETSLDSNFAGLTRDPSLKMADYLR